LTTAICFGWTDPSGRVPKRIRNPVLLGKNAPPGNFLRSRTQPELRKRPRGPFTIVRIPARLCALRTRYNFATSAVSFAEKDTHTERERERERERGKSNGLARVLSPVIGIVELHRRANRSASTHQPASARSREEGDLVGRTEHGSLMRSDYGRRTVSAPSNAF